MNISISSEQNKIIEFLNQGSHVIVDAVAGSGKSTAVLFVAKHFPDKRILQLTYNTALRQELKVKVVEASLTNLDVHTFHSLAVKHYLRTSFTDIGLRSIVSNNMLPELVPLPSYDIIVIDEAQDMTVLFFRFAYKVINDMKKFTGNSGGGSCRRSDNMVQLLILGDYMQSLYEFKGADARFLTMAEQIWFGHPQIAKMPFIKTGLRTSYRITQPMSQFVNQVLLGEDRLEAPKEGVPVMYIRYNRFNCVNKIIFEITNLIENEGAIPSDIFILAGSLRGYTNQIKNIENELVERGIPCNVPMFENEGMDERVIQGKLVFSTFHSVKGRQRPYVFVLGFSQTYMDFMQKDASHDICPPTLYVATTRALKRLYLFEEDNGLDDGPLKFMKMSHNELNDVDFVNFLGIPKTNSFWELRQQQQDQSNECDNGGNGGNGRRIYTSPTELVRFISENVYDYVIPILEKHFILERKPLDIPLDIPTVQLLCKGGYEEISDINGIALPCMYFDQLRRRQQPNKLVEGGNSDGGIQKKGNDWSCLGGIVTKEMERLRKQRRPNGKIFSMLENILKTSNNNSSDTADYLFMANAYIALKENLYFKLYQISKDDYNWLQPNVIEECFKNIHDSIGNEIQPGLGLGPGQCRQDEEKVERVERVERANLPFILEETLLEYQDELPELDERLLANGIRLFRFHARVDLVTPITVWELKCTSHLTIEHYLQVVLYAWLWRTVCHYPSREFRILNIKTGEIQLLNMSDEILNDVVYALLRNKCKSHKVVSDLEFIANSAENVSPPP